MHAKESNDMKTTELELKGAKLLELRIHGDARGFFTERYNRESFREAGIDTEFVQDNHSRSEPGAIRGLHYQVNPSQSKLVGVVRGAIWDVIVDIRQGSPSFGRHLGIELSDSNGLLLWVPAGFAHGFCVLGDEPADVLYKVDAPYSPSGEGGILWSDTDLSIHWPLKDGQKPLVSARDRALARFSDYRSAPKFSYLT